MTRVGVIGLGFGTSVLLPAFRAIPGFKVVALGGSSPDRARATAERLAVPFSGTGDDVLDMDIDVVAIATPPGPGAELCARALERNLCVLAEKPLADSYSRARELARSANGRIVGVDFELAELDCYRELKRRLQGATVRSARFEWRLRSYAQTHKKWGWKTDRARHGGVMTLLGSHALFLAEWLLGPIENIGAHFACSATAAFAPVGADPAEDRASIGGTVRGGVPLEIELDNAVEGDGQRWEIDLDAFRLVLSEDRAKGTMQLERVMGAVREVIATDRLLVASNWQLEPVRRLTSRFAQSVLGKRKFWPDFEAGARVQALLEAAGNSAALHGERVAV